MSLTPDEQRILCMITIADGPVNTTRLFDAINPYPWLATGPERRKMVGAWCRRNAELEAAEASLGRRRLIYGVAAGWNVSLAGHAALMLSLEDAMTAGGGR